jgi:hypothetical protein
MLFKRSLLWILENINLNTPNAVPQTALGTLRASSVENRHRARPSSGCARDLHGETGDREAMRRQRL